MHMVYYGLTNDR